MWNTLSALAKRSKVVMTFLAVVFVLASPLEALACVAEGCDVSCVEQAANPAVTDAGDPSSDDCAKSNCPCIVGHCAHAAVLSVPVAAKQISVSHAVSVRFAATDLISTTLQTPERPPRA